MTIFNKINYIFLICLFLFTTCISGVNHDFDCTAHELNGEPPSWVNNGGIILILIGLVIMFWSLAIICEEYFVPALHILCVELKIADDIAGATFMAAGASSPELFISFLGLFVQNSTIGVGTLLGSEIFNHMIICAGSIFYAKDGELKLNARIFTRECIAYLFSLITLLFVVKSDFLMNIESTFDSTTYHDCLIVYWFGPIVLIVFYCVYILFLRYFDVICLYIYPNEIPYEFPQSEYIHDTNSKKWIRRTSVTIPNSPGLEINQPIKFSENVNPLNNIEDPQIEIPELYPNNDQGNEFNKGNKMKKKSISNGKESEKSNITTDNNVNNDNNVLKIENLEPIVIHASILDLPKLTLRTEENINSLYITIHDNITLGYHYLVYPIKFLMYYSIPDVKSHPSMQVYYKRAIVLSTVWLAILSFIMLTLCSILGDWIQVTPLQMGLTLSAIGTSFPNLWSSMIVASEGFGDMAVSNALGSNIFNTCIGLGLPLFLFISFNLHEENYSQMTNGGVDILILLLIFILLIFYVIIALSNWKMKTWMSYVFVAGYVGTISFTLYLTTIAEQEKI
jgi:K+-dependent Na+/Ca+ exchanger-like protein